MEIVDTYIWIQEMLDIYTYWLVEVTQKVKDSLEVVRQHNECAIVLLFQGHD